MIRLLTFTTVGFCHALRQMMSQALHTIWHGELWMHAADCSTPTDLPNLLVGAWLNTFMGTCLCSSWLQSTAVVSLSMAILSTSAGHALLRQQ